MRRGLIIFLVLLIILSNIGDAIKYPSQREYVSKIEILYFPTKYYAEKTIDELEKYGNLHQRIIDTEYLSTKMLELSSMYHYTGDERYKKYAKRIEEILEGIYDRYGFIPKYVDFDLKALDIENVSEFIFDTIKASNLLLHEFENIENYLEFEEEGEFYCFVGTREMIEQMQKTGEIQCPYIAEYETRFGNKTILAICNKNYKNVLKYKYKIKPEALFKDKLEPGDIIIEEVYAKINETYVEVSIDSGVKYGILLHILNKPIEYFRDAFISRAFEDIDFKLGMYGNRNNFKQIAGYQFYKVLFMNGTGRESDLNICKEFCMLRGRISGFYSEENVLDYDITLPPRIKVLKILDGISFEGKQIESKDLKLDGNVIRVVNKDSPRKIMAYIVYKELYDTRIYYANDIREFFDKKFVKTDLTEYKIITYPKNVTIKVNETETILVELGNNVKVENGTVTVINNTPYLKVERIVTKEIPVEMNISNVKKLLCEIYKNGSVNLLHYAITNYYAINPRSKVAKELYESLLLFKPVKREINLGDCVIEPLRFKYLIEKYKEYYNKEFYKWVKERLFESYLNRKKIDVKAIEIEAKILGNEKALELIEAYKGIWNTSYEDYFEFLKHYYPELIEELERGNITYVQKNLNKTDEVTAKILSKLIQEIFSRLNEMRKEIFEKAKRGIFDEKLVREYLGELRFFHLRDINVETAWNLYLLNNTKEALKILGYIEKPRKKIPEIKRNETIQKPPEVEIPKERFPINVIVFALIILIIGIVIYIKFLRRIGRRR